MDDSNIIPYEQRQQWIEDPSVQRNLDKLTPNQRRIMGMISPKAIALPMTATWAFAAVAMGLHPGAAMADPTIQVLSASPAISQPADGDNIVRSTISPNGDNIDDTVAYTVQTTPGADVQMTVNYWVVGEDHIVTLGPVQANAQGIAIFVWDGKDANGNTVQDGGYNMTFCHPDNPGTPIVTPPLPPGHVLGSAFHCGCGILAKILAERESVSIAAGAAACGGNPQAAAQVNNLSASLPGATINSVQSGASTQLDINSDRDSGFDVQLRSDDDSQTFMDYGQMNAGTSTLAIPANLQSGQYRVRVSDGIGDVRNVPLVVRDAPLNATPAPGTILTVSPTLTWRAYDFADADQDGFTDSWYTYNGQSGGGNMVSLLTPYQRPDLLGEAAGGEIDRSAAQGYWQLLRQHPEWHVESVTDYEFGQMSQSVLNQYAGVIFPGHTEYFTAQMLAHAHAYKAAGGNMAFWSTNNFYSQVTIDETDGIETQVHRPLYSPNKTRVDYPLIGQGYIFCCFPIAGDTNDLQYTLTQAGLTELPWLYQNTGLAVGTKFGIIGGEIDDQIPGLSPKGGIIGAVSPLSYWDPNYKVQMNVQVPMLWMPPQPTQGIGGVFSSGSMGFLGGVDAAPDVSGPVVQIVQNVQNYLAATPHVSPTDWMPPAVLLVKRHEARDLAPTTVKRLSKLHPTGAASAEATMAALAQLAGDASRAKIATIARTSEAKLPVALAASIARTGHLKAKQVPALTAAIIALQGNPRQLVALMGKYHLAFAKAKRH